MPVTKKENPIYAPRIRGHAGRSPALQLGRELWMIFSISKALFLCEAEQFCIQTAAGENHLIQSGFNVLFCQALRA